MPRRLSERAKAAAPGFPGPAALLAILICKLFFDILPLHPDKIPSGQFHRLYLFFHPGDKIGIDCSLRHPDCLPLIAEVEHSMEFLSFCFPYDPEDGCIIIIFRIYFCIRIKDRFRPSDLLQIFQAVEDATFLCGYIWNPEPSQDLLYRYNRSPARSRRHCRASGFRTE